MAAGSYTVEIGFTGTEGFGHLERALDKLEAIKLKYPWVVEEIEAVQDDIALAATMIGITNRSTEK